MDNPVNIFIDQNLPTSTASLHFHNLVSNTELPNKILTRVKLLQLFDLKKKKKMSCFASGYVATSYENCTIVKIY